MDHIKGGFAMDGMWWILLGVVLLSPLGVPVLLSKRWSADLVSRARFLIGAVGLLLVIITFSFLLVDKLVSFGVKHWYLQGRSCGRELFCSAFDFVFAARGLVSLGLYVLLAWLVLYGIKKRQPGWLGFRSKMRMPIASGS